MIHNIARLICILRSSSGSNPLPWRQFRTIARSKILVILVCISNRPRIFSVEYTVLYIRNYLGDWRQLPRPSPCNGPAIGFNKTKVWCLNWTLAEKMLLCTVSVLCNISPKQEGCLCCFYIIKSFWQGMILCQHAYTWWLCIFLYVSLVWYKHTVYMHVCY